MVESNAFANPHNNSVTVTQPDGGVALDPHDSRLTQVSNMDGMLWTGAGISAGPDKEGKGCRAGIRDCDQVWQQPHFTPQGQTWQRNV